MHGTTIKI